MAFLRTIHSTKHWAQYVGAHDHDEHTCVFVIVQVSDLAAGRDGPGLPHVERIRLNMHHLLGAKTDRHKEVRCV